MPGSRPGHGDAALPWRRLLSCDARSLKYAVVERERRYLVAKLPDGVTSTADISDRYVEGTRLRLREVRGDDGTVIRKLGHEVRLTEGPDEVTYTNMYLDDEEWALLVSLPARTLRKKRHLIAHDEAWTGVALAR